MRAEVLSIGSELLSGDITDTNATFLAQEMMSLGIQLCRVTQVGDRLPDLTEVLGSAMGRADLIVCTGGIGPTPDDLTREAIAEVLGETMVVDPDLEAALRAYFSQRSYEMPERNLKQATLIRSARPLRNRSGTAPGWWVEHDGKLVITLPGVPREMKTIWQEEVRPRLEGSAGTTIVTHTFKTFGLGESTVAEMLGDLLIWTPPTVATYAKRDGVHVTITAADRDESEARRLVEAAAVSVRAVLGDAIWGSNGDDTLPSVVTRLLDAEGVTLATQELATAGLLAAELSAELSPSYLGGGVGNGTPPASAYTLRVGQSRRTSINGRDFSECDVVLLEQDREVTRVEVRVASGGALAERATVAALHLLRQRLLARADAAAR